MKLGVKMSPTMWSVISSLNDELIENEVYSNILNFHVMHDKVNYLDILKQDDGAVHLSYLPAGRKLETEDKPYFAKGRQSGRIARVLAKVLIDDQNESQMRVFAEKLASVISDKNFELRIVSGKDIRPFYLMDNYAEGSNSELWKSCMRYDKCQKWFGIYEDNPNLKMVVALKEGKVMARALVWENLQLDNPNTNLHGDRKTTGDNLATLIGKTEGLTMIDRIYAVNPFAKDYLYKWAVANADLVFDKHKDLNRFFIPKVGKVATYVMLRQPLEKYKYLSYPWIDTLQFYSIEEKCLSNHITDGTRKGMRFSDANGGFLRLTEASPSLTTIAAELGGETLRTTTFAVGGIPV